MYFRDIAGLDDLKAYLIRTAQTGQVAHAQLFFGEEGGGAFPLALAYARYLNCQSRTPTDSCGHCPSCLKYDALAHPDLFFIYPVVKSSKSETPSDDFLNQWRKMLLDQPYFVPDDWNDSIKAGNSQPMIYSADAADIERKLGYLVYEAAYRVVMIWQPERMNDTFANKLLKLLEEPPQRTLFFLVSAQPSLLLETVQSRMQLLEVRKLHETEIVEALAQNNSLDMNEIVHVAHLAGGNYRRALDMRAGEWEDRTYFELFGKMMGGVVKSNPAKMRSIAEEIAGIGRINQIEFLSYCLHFFREVYISKVNILDLNYLSVDEEPLVNMLKGGVTGKNIRPIMEEIELAIRHIRQNGNGRMIFFDLFLRLTALLAPALSQNGLK